MTTQVADKKKLHEDFWQGRGPSLIFIPPADIPLYDTNDYEKRFYDPPLMLKSEIERAKPVLEWPTDSIACVRSNLGTIFMPAILGQKFTIRNGQMPWAGEHLSVSEIIYSLENIDIDNSEVMQLAAAFYTKLKTSQTGIKPYLPDTQGVFDILHLLSGTDLFYKLADDDLRDVIKRILTLISEFYVKVTESLKKASGEAYNSMVHGHGTPQGLYFPHAGIRLSEDTATLISPQMIDEFVLPYMRTAAVKFGSAFVHYCGRHEYLYEKIVNLDFVCAIDLGNPEMYDTHWLFEKCAETNTVFYGKIQHQNGESWRDYIERIAESVKSTGARCVLRPTVFPKEKKECEQMRDIWHEMTL